MRLGVFGGTFNPIHYGHLRAAEETRELLSLDRVLFIPSGTPPLKKADIAAAADRLEMTRLAVSGNPSFELLDIECAAAGKSYTVTTLETLNKQWPKADLVFMLGIDAFLDLPNWWQPDRLVTLADFAIFARPGGRFSDLAVSPFVGRESERFADMDQGGEPVCRIALTSGRGAHLLRTTPIAITATGIRSRIQEGRSIKYLLPEKVESFIISHNLYASARPR